MKVPRKAVWIAFGVLVVAGLVIGNLVRSREPKHKAETEKVTLRDLEAMVSGSGWIEPRRKVDVSANTAGRVVELAIEEGDTVALGQVLLRIDPAPFRGAVDRLRAAISAARADLDAAAATEAQSKADLERIEALAKRQLASTNELDTARRSAARATAGVSAARARLRQEEAMLRTAVHDLDQVTITASMDGVITRLNIDEGETVVTGTMNNPGTVLLTIADLSVMEAEIEIDETDVVDVRLGQDVRVTVDAFPDTTLKAVVTEVGSSARRDFTNPGETSADFPVTVRLLQTIPGLRPGLSATAEIVTARRSRVPSVSIGALSYRDPAAEAKDFAEAGRRKSGPGVAEGKDEDDEAAADTLGTHGKRRPETYGVFLIEGRRARFVPVTIGVTGERHIEITGGVEEGTSIVAGPFQVLREIRSGDRVEVARKGRKSRPEK